MPAPSRDIEIVVEQHDPLTEKFYTGPNALYRAEADETLGFDFTGYTLRERCLLAALCSMRSGFKCNRKRIDRLAPELKRDALDTVLLGLRRKGHLRIVRRNSGTGKFAYQWSVSLRPVPEWAAAEAAQREQRQLAAGVAPAADEPLDAAAAGRRRGRRRFRRSGHGWISRRRFIRKRFNQAWFIRKRFIRRQ